MATDIKRKRGDTAADVFTLTDSAGAALNITGFSFLLSVSSLENPPDSTNQLYQLTGAIIDATGGIVEFTPSAANADQDPEVYFYDVQMTDGASRIKTIEKGKYEYEQDITK